MEMCREREVRLSSDILSSKFQHLPKVGFLFTMIYQMHSSVHLVNLHILPEITSLDLGLSLTLLIIFANPLFFLFIGNLDRWNFIV